MNNEQQDPPERGHLRGAQQSSQEWELWTVSYDEIARLWDVRNEMTEGSGGLNSGGRLGGGQYTNY